MERSHLISMTNWSPVFVKKQNVGSLPLAPAHNADLRATEITSIWPDPLQFTANIQWRICPDPDTTLRQATVNFSPCRHRWRTHGRPYAGRVRQGYQLGSPPSRAACSLSMCREASPSSATISRHPPGPSGHSSNNSAMHMSAERFSFLEPSPIEA